MANEKFEAVFDTMKDTVSEKVNDIRNDGFSDETKKFAKGLVVVALTGAAVWLGKKVAVKIKEKRNDAKPFEALCTEIKEKLNKGHEVTEEKKNEEEATKTDKKKK